VVKGELRVTTPAPAESGGAPLLWCFPFSAAGEAPPGGATVHLRADAKAPTTVALTLPLPGFAGSGGEWTLHLRVLDVVSDGLPAALLEAVGVEDGGGGSSAPAAGSARAAVSGAALARAAALGLSAASAHLSSEPPPPPLQHGAACEAPSAETAAAATLLSDCVSFSPRGVGGGSSPALAVEAALAPRRPLGARCELVAAHSGGGVWRFPTRVSFAGPAPEGTLALTAPALHATAGATVLLANHAPSRARYAASLSLDTPAAFRVAAGVSSDRLAA